MEHPAGYLIWPSSFARIDTSQELLNTNCIKSDIANTWISWPMKMSVLIFIFIAGKDRFELICKNFGLTKGPRTQLTFVL